MNVPKVYILHVRADMYNVRSFSPSMLLVGFEMATSDHTSQSLFDSNSTIYTKEQQHLYLQPGKMATIIDHNTHNQNHSNTTTIKLISEEEMFNRGAFIIPRPLCSLDSNNMIPFAAVECNGPFVPCSFYPLESIYNVISTGGQIFDDIKLEGDGDWSDYDDNLGESAIVTNLEGRSNPWRIYKGCFSYTASSFTTFTYQECLYLLPPSINGSVVSHSRLNEFLRTSLPKRRIIYS